MIGNPVEGWRVSVASANVRVVDHVQNTILCHALRLSQFMNDYPAQESSMVPLLRFHYSQPDPAGLTRRVVSIPALPSAAWVRRMVAGGGCIIMAAKIMGGTPPCTQTRHRGRVNSSALRWPRWIVLGNADVSRCCGDSPTSYSVPIKAASELIEELVYSVVCMCRDFSRIRRQIALVLIAALRLGGTCWPDAAVYRYTRLRSLLGLRRLKPSRTPCT